jgi:hypothetical protein
MPQAKRSSTDVLANLATLRERLVSSLTLSPDRLQETMDDAVRRGRMTRRDAEDLLTSLVAAGRQQTDALLSDLEQLLGFGGGVVGKARRAAGVSSFPIAGYDDLTAAEVNKRLGDLTPAQLRKVRDHERRHAARRSVLRAIDRKLG